MDISMDEFVYIIDNVAKKYELKLTNIITEMIEDLIKQFYKNNIPVRDYTSCGFQDSSEYRMALHRLETHHLDLIFTSIVLLNSFDELVKTLENRNREIPNNVVYFDKK